MDVVIELTTFDSDVNKTLHEWDGIFHSFQRIQVLEVKAKHYAMTAADFSSL